MPEPGLRERKKVRTRSAIQHHALRLVLEQGYQATTVSQIAEAADISESTFFRYFPTKEALFLQDDFDEPFIESFRAQPPELNPIQAMRAALREAFQDITPEELEDGRQRAALMLSEPELRDAVAGQILGGVSLAANLVAARLGRPPEDVRVRALAGALLGTLVAVVMPLSGSLEADYLEVMDQALAELEAGFGFG